MNGLQGKTVHPELGEVPYRLDQVSSNPDRQVDQTIRRMREYAILSALTPTIRQDLEQAFVLGDGDILTGVHRWVKGVMRFREDEDTVSRLDTPEPLETIEVLIPPMDLSAAVNAGISPAEDCDGFAMYVASLLAAAGIRCAFVAVAADPFDPTRYSHVYVAAYPELGMRVPLDASHGEYAGWECPNRFNKRREWPLQTERSTVWPAVIALGLIGGAAFVATRN